MSKISLSGRCPDDFNFRKSEAANSEATGTWKHRSVTDWSTRILASVPGQWHVVRDLPCDCQSSEFGQMLAIGFYELTRMTFELCQCFRPNKSLWTLSLLHASSCFIRIRVRKVLGLGTSYQWLASSHQDRIYTRICGHTPLFQVLLSCFCSRSSRVCCADSDDLSDHGFNAFRMSAVQVAVGCCSMVQTDG